ncbi:hypothetical protein GGS23DRAFT_319615 [Durotheca rogersii]|uniref:uncharacterized protein n=1 Tax=Durotheca rogersii TaxID=419775 RepID=UPI0022201E8E|nr:uncharacterized protein GGS23DRAFT_319615 [Durotheca rogersii]KAI5859484.1 hypothetical protein GGS23DRAFT_319615 [Durotheca rogersii]
MGFVPLTTAASPLPPLCCPPQLLTAHCCDAEGDAQRRKRDGPADLSRFARSPARPAGADFRNLVSPRPAWLAVAWASCRSAGLVGRVGARVLTQTCVSNLLGTGAAAMATDRRWLVTGSSRARAMERAQRHGRIYPYRNRPDTYITAEPTARRRNTPNSRLYPIPFYVHPCRRLDLAHPPSRERGAAPAQPYLVLPPSIPIPAATCLYLQAVHAYQHRHAHNTHPHIYIYAYASIDIYTYIYTGPHPLTACERTVNTRVCAVGGIDVCAACACVCIVCLCECECVWCVCTA